MGTAVDTAACFVARTADGTQEVPYACALTQFRNPCMAVVVHSLC